MSRAMAVSGLRQEANPALKPESQRGWEIGAELHFDERVVLRTTWYDQTANDLIQQVPLRRDGVERVYQFQNLGSISNQGIELEAAWRAGRLTGTGALFFNRSRVERLSPHYTGEFQAGDEPPEVPDAVGAIRLRYDHGPLGLELGGWWLGSWTGYDWAAVLSAQPARAADRDYWIEYPGGFRPWVAASWRIQGGWQVHTRIDNPGNSTGTSRTNVTPPAGRVALLGIRLEP
jgi:outer membrane receptor protein involved in Fe transport